MVDVIIDESKSLFWRQLIPSTYWVVFICALFWRDLVDVKIINEVFKWKEPNKGEQKNWWFLESTLHNFELRRLEGGLSSWILTAFSDGCSHYKESFLMSLSSCPQQKYFRSWCGLLLKPQLRWWWRWSPGEEETKDEEVCWGLRQTYWSITRRPWLYLGTWKIMKTFRIRNAILVLKLRLHL